MSIKECLNNFMELLGAALFGAVFGAAFLFAIIYFEQDIFNNSIFWNVSAGVLGAIIGSCATAYLAEMSKHNQIKLSAKVAAANLDYYLNDMSSISIKLLTIDKDLEPIDDILPVLDLHSTMRSLDEHVVILNNDSARLLKQDIIDMTRKLELAKIKIVEYIKLHNELSNKNQTDDSIKPSRSKNASTVISLVDSTRDKLFSFQKKFL